MTAKRCRERNKNPGLDAKAWLNGHIVQLRPDGFILQTRFYPHINIHLSEQTPVRCKKHILKTTDLEMDDLITVEGLERTASSKPQRSLFTAIG
jgi:hypothetical protein